MEQDASGAALLLLWTAGVLLLRVQDGEHDAEQDTRLVVHDGAEQDASRVGSGAWCHLPDLCHRGVTPSDARTAGMPLDQIRAVLEGLPDEAAALVRAHVQAVQDGVAPARRAAERVLAALGDAPAASTAMVSGPELVRAVQQVAGAAAAPARPRANALVALTGVLLKVDADEVRFVATDRYRLALRVLPAPRSYFFPQV